MAGRHGCDGEQDDHDRVRWALQRQPPGPLLRGPLRRRKDHGVQASAAVPARSRNRFARRTRLLVVDRLAGLFFLPGHAGRP